MGVGQAIDLAGEDLKTVLALLEWYLPGTEAWAYGSRVKWTSRPKSDLDLVVFASPEQGRQVGDLREAFEESNLPFRIDLFVWDDVPVSFREQIRVDHVVLVPSGIRQSWRTARFGDIARLVRDSVAPNGMGDVTYIGLEHIGEGSLSLLGVGSARDVQSTKLRFKQGDILFGKLRPYFRKVIRVRMNGICSTDIWVVRPQSGIEPGYLFYVMASPEFIDAAVQGSEGTKMPRAKWDFVSLHKCSVPPTAAQRAIAHILGTLDDKIELNRRMNETLEAMARALFKSWFVDFDPVRAKMEGRDTGLPPELADLFPDRLVDSELGKIPEGWTVGSLGDITALRRRGIDPWKVASDTPYIGLQHMPRRSVALMDWGRASTVSSRKSTFEIGDILFGKLRPYFHKVGIAPVDGLCSTDIVVLNARIPKWFAFVLSCVSSSAFVAHTSQTSTGTKMPRTSWQAMSTYELCRPTDVIASEFQCAVSSMLGQVVRNVHESRTLSALRDTLLPKLISGELRVHDAKELMGAFA